MQHHYYIFSDASSSIALASVCFALASKTALSLQMSALKAVGKPGQEEDVAQVHRIRITLTSRNVKNLEKGEQQPNHMRQSHAQHMARSDAQSLPDGPTSFH